MVNPTNKHNEALLSIGQVIDQIGAEYPDVSRSALRFLEREGLVTPLRSAGNHRHFRKSDIERIRQVKQWQRENHSLQEIRSRLQQRDQLPSMENLATAFLHDLLSGNLAEARRLVLDAVDIGLAPENALDGIIAPTMSQIGNLWHDGTLSVAQEKIASELVRDLISEISRRAETPAPDGPCIVAACVEHEQHELGLRSIVAALKCRGVRVYYLGASVSPSFLHEAISLYRPGIVLLSAKLDQSVDPARMVIKKIRELPWGDERPAVVIGGDGADRHKRELEAMGAHVISGRSLAQAADVIQQALDEKRRGTVGITGDSA